MFIRKGEDVRGHMSVRGTDVLDSCSMQSPRRLPVDNYHSSCAGYSSWVPARYRGQWYQIQIVHASVVVTPTVHGDCET